MSNDMIPYSKASSWLSDALKPHRELPSTSHLYAVQKNQFNFLIHFLTLVRLQ